MISKTLSWTPAFPKDEYSILRSFSEDIFNEVL